MTDHFTPSSPRSTVDHVGGEPAPAPAALGEAEQLIELLAAQRDLYRQLQQLSDRQAQCIKEAQTEDLLGVLTQRQGLVDRLGAINERIGPLRERIGQLAQRLSEDRRRVLRELVDEVRRLLQTIIERDEADRRQLESAKAQTASQAGRTTRTGTALNAYRQPTPSQPRFADHAG